LAGETEQVLNFISQNNQDQAMYTISRLNQSDLEGISATKLNQIQHFLFDQLKLHGNRYSFSDQILDSEGNSIRRNQLQVNIPIKIQLFFEWSFTPDPDFLENIEVETYKNFFKYIISSIPMNDSQDYLHTQILRFLKKFNHLIPRTGILNELQAQLKILSGPEFHIDIRMASMDILFQNGLISPQEITQYYNQAEDQSIKNKLRQLMVKVNPSLIYSEFEQEKNRSQKIILAQILINTTEYGNMVLRWKFEQTMPNYDQESPFNGFPIDGMFMNISGIPNHKYHLIRPFLEDPLLSQATLNRYFVFMSAIIKDYDTSAEIEQYLLTAMNSVYPEVKILAYLKMYLITDDEQYFNQIQAMKPLITAENRDNFSLFFDIISMDQNYPMDDDGIGVLKVKNLFAYFLDDGRYTDELERRENNVEIRPEVESCVPRSTGNWETTSRVLRIVPLEESIFYLTFSTSLERLKRLKDQLLSSSLDGNQKQVIDDLIEKSQELFDAEMDITRIERQTNQTQSQLERYHQLQNRRTLLQNQINTTRHAIYNWAWENSSRGRNYRNPLMNMAYELTQHNGIWIGTYHYQSLEFGVYDLR